ncbi:MAG: hypothetical protein LBK96_07165 [Prevotellaceae bacterium]|jgi:hypothetical protein|nr:hypothetical protein [Prevotellaceae bacterium]
MDNVRKTYMDSLGKLDFQMEKTKKHILGFNLNYQEVADKHDNNVYAYGISRVYNISSNYGLLFIPVNLQLNAAANVIYI